MSDFLNSVQPTGLALQYAINSKEERRKYRADNYSASSSGDVQIYARKFKIFTEGLIFIMPERSNLLHFVVFI